MDDDEMDFFDDPDELERALLALPATTSTTREDEAVRFRAIAEEAVVVERRLQDVDSALRQLLIACELRGSLETCISSHSPRPVEADVLSSGSLLLVALVHNRSRFTLEQWLLAISVQSLSQSGCEWAFSRTIALPALTPDCDFRCDFLHSDSLRLPVLIECDLLKVFQLDDASPAHILRLRVGHRFISLWDLARPRPRYIPDHIAPITRTVNAADCGQTIEMILPEALVCLICADMKATEEGLLQWLLPYASPGSEAVMHVNEGKVQVAVKAQFDGHYAITITAADGDLRWQLLGELQLRLLLFIARLWKWPRHASPSTAELDCKQTLLTSLLEKFEPPQRGRRK